MFQLLNTGGRKISIFVPESAGSEKGGFTLIEIIVVICLISLMLVFSFPRLSGFLSVNNKNKLVRWMIIQRTVLKTKAVQEQKPYLLRVDISGDRLQTMARPADGAEPESLFGEEKTGDTDKNHVDGQFDCSGGLEIVGVVRPDGETVMSGTVDILFSEKGYCDRVIIHMREGNDRFSVYIEPFLPQVDVYAGHIKFGRSWEEWS